MRSMASMMQKQRRVWCRETHLCVRIHLCAILPSTGIIIVNYPWSLDCLLLLSLSSVVMFLSPSTLLLPTESILLALATATGLLIFLRDALLLMSSSAHSPFHFHLLLPPAACISLFLWLVVSPKCCLRLLQQVSQC